MKSVWVIFTVLFLSFNVKAAIAASSKIDTVYFQHGDKITGEMISLSKGILKLKTDDAGTINIEWKKIDSLCVLNPVRILKHNGGILFGQMYPSGKRGVCFVQGKNNEKTEVELQAIVELIQLEKRILDRLSGTLSAGYSYIKATEVTQLDFSGNVEYKGEKTIVSANYNIVFTNDASEITQRQSGAASYYRILPNNWSVQGKILGESNSEFQLDLRTSVITGLSYGFIRSNTQVLQSGAGISLNREFSGDLAQNGFDGLVGLKYSLFLLESPEVSINFEGYLFPGFKQFGRVRSNINSDVKWEIFKDFYLKGSLFFSSDNQPLSGVDVRTDWGTSLGLEFKF